MLQEDSTAIVEYIVPSSYALDTLLLSIIMAFICPIMAMQLDAKLLHQANYKSLFKLQFGIGIIQGLGLWSMHYFGMLAMEIDITIGHDVSATLLSLLTAIFTGHMITTTSHDYNLRTINLFARGLIICGGISLTHFFGMMSLHTNAHVTYQTPAIMLAFVLSLIIMLLALRLKFNSEQRQKKGHPSYYIILSGGLVALAFITLHYIMMAGTIFTVSDSSTSAHTLASQHDHHLIIWLLAIAIIISIGLFISFLRLGHRQELITQMELNQDYTREIIGNTAEGIIVIDSQGLIVTFNPAAERIFGYQASDVIGNNVAILLPEREQQQHQQYTDASTLHAPRIINRGRDLEGRKKDGTLFPLELNIAPLTIGGQRGFVGVTRDITDRKMAAQALQSSNERLGFLLKSSPMVIYTCHPSGDFSPTYVSPNIKEHFGYEPEEFTNNSSFWIDHIHPNDKNGVIEQLRQLIERVYHKHDYRFKMKNGQYRWVHDELHLLKDDNGNILEIVGSWTDIDDKKQTEITLERSENRFRRSQIFANIGTWDWDIHSGELYWSERIGPLFGYPEGNLETTYDNFLNAVHPDDRQQVIDAVNNCVENNTEYDIEHRVVWPNGEVRWVHEQGDVTRADDGTPSHMLGVVIDITRRKLLEDQLHEKQALLDLLRQGMIDYVANNDFTAVSDNLLDGLLELTGSEYGFTGEILHDESGIPYLKTHAITNIAWNHETQQIYDEHASQGMKFTNLDTLFGEVINTGACVIANDPAHDSRRGGLPDGHPPLHAFLGIPVYYGNEIVGMYGLANRSGGYDEELVDFLRPFDLTYGVITHARRLTQTEEQNMRDLKMAKQVAEKASHAKTEFLSRMSHELRTPMNAILGFTQILQVDTDKVLPPSYQQSLKEIMNAGQHLLELINDILDLARIESGKLQLSLEPIALRDLFTACENLIMPLVSEHGLSIEFSQPKNISFMGDMTKIKQVMLNLLSNAVKYNRKHGHIKVWSELSNDKMLISVQDQGMGIPEERQNELFTAFSRIDADNTGIEGTGIGLVITRNLMERMGGHIDFSCTEDEGTTFWITLPLLDQQPHESSATGNHNVNNSAALQAGPQTFSILYVEDNEVNIRLIQQALQNHAQLTLTTATTAEQGLELLNNQLYDLILLDIYLPGMSGFDLLKIIRSNPATHSIPVFGISANAMQADIDQAKQAGFDRYITKPVDLGRLISAINSVRNIRTG